MFTSQADNLHESGNPGGSEKGLMGTMKHRETDCKLSVARTTHCAREAGDTHDLAQGPPHAEQRVN